VVELDEVFGHVQNALRWRLAWGGGSLGNYVIYCSNSYIIFYFPKAILHTHNHIFKLIKQSTHGVPYLSTYQFFISTIISCN
jgi:hypothetical protein